ncbi:universal stress protein [Qipengyuania sp. YG27]|uniref:Universal stress protein n=1 Tax=Qipengyuania mesophila TaxID=2867246 RepID=A0ABS7JWC9_9SPHN|nr:universal stress protein [Qipengyuania mesophila]MBX7501883.1 universal stress protein [Qipengyuania mesophila]
MRSILLHAHDDGSFDRRLDVALDLARAFDGHLTILHTFPYSVGTMTDLQGAAFAAMAPIWKEQAEEMRAKVAADMANEDVPWDWHEAIGPAALGLLQHSSLMDLIVLGAREPVDLGRAPSWTAGELAISARCPVLVLPEDSKRFDVAAPALVAWDGSAEASHALRAALPFLARAEGVFLASVAEERAGDSELPPLGGADYLTRHGIACDVVELPDPGKQGVAGALVEAAEQRQCGLVVMGAYGRTRLAERIFGGVTRAMLDKVRLPLLMTH